MISVLFSTQIWANTPDTSFENPITIDANTQSIDIESNTLSFQGDVIIKQGTLKIIAQQLDVIRTAQEQSELLIATGSPVEFSFETDNQQKISAFANKITYSVSTHLLTLEGQAKIVQADSEVSSDKIEYNLQLKKMVASSTPDEHSRVRTVLTPSKGK